MRDVYEKDAEAFGYKITPVTEEVQHG